MDGGTVYSYNYLYSALRFVRSNYSCTLVIERSGRELMLSLHTLVVYVHVESIGMADKTRLVTHPSFFGM